MFEYPWSGCLETLSIHLNTQISRKVKKIGLSPVAKQYRVSALFTNAQTCLYKNNTSKFFEVDPPLLEEYFV